MSASAGRVLLMGKGAYNSGTTYYPLDYVRYQGATYVCKQTSTGNLPTDTTYFQLLAQDGEEGQVSLQMLEDTVGWIGKNALPNKATTTTYRGITYIVNADKTISLDDGTATGGASLLEIAPVGTFAGYTGKYILSGCPSGGSSSYSLDLREGNGSITYNGNNVRDYGNGIEFDFSQLVNGSNPVNPADIRCIIRIAENTSGGNGVFKPMLRRASVADDTYEPYHENVDTAKANTSSLAPVENGPTASQSYAQGSPFMRNGDFCTAKTAIASGETLTENSNYTVGTVGDSMKNIITSATLGESASTYGITLDSSSANNKVVRYGNVVTFKVGFVVASDVTVDANVYPIVLGYEPVVNNPRIDVIKRDSPYESVSGHARVGTGGGINLRYLPLQAGTYDLQGTYICQ